MGIYAQGAEDTTRSFFYRHTEHGSFTAYKACIRRNNPYKPKC
jgi:hypothetical protein